jgi:hypothetical protein
MRPSLVIFCCSLSAAVAYSGINYHEVLAEADHVSTNQNVNLHNLPIPNLDLQHPHISEFQAISDRPLFTPSRRPTPASAAVQVPVYRLRGVLTTGSQKIALVESIGDGALLRLSEGDTVDVWLVSAIGKNSITWSRLGQLHEMVVAEMGEEGGALSSPDTFNQDLSGENGPSEQSNGPDELANDANERANVSSRLNRPRRHTGGHRHLTHSAEDAPIDRLAMPTAPLPPTPMTPRPPLMRRVWNPKESA